MNDISHLWGNDIGVSAVGDLGLASDTLRGQQRVLRRLLTNPGDNIFHPTYGAGLARFVGSTATAEEIKALIRGQMLLEEAVAKSPAPVIEVHRITNGIAVQVNYNDAPTGQPVVLSFNVSQ
ncbi:phage tail protein [Dyella halodurans]